MTARLIIERDRLFADNANRAAVHGIITPENVRPVSKNPIIAAFFKEIGRADELGSGTRNLYHYTRLYSGADPIIDEEDAFSVTVPLNDSYSPEVGKGTHGNDITTANTGNGTVSGLKSGPLSGLKSGPLNGPLKDRVMNLIAEIPGVNRKELVRRTGVSERTMTRNLSELERSGKIERRGGKKTGGYFLAKGSGEKRVEGQSK
jgi:ATP-dependent DNA helicase RecG